MSELASVISACAGLVTAIGVIVVAVMQKRQGRTQAIIHELVNSSMGEQLRIGMVSARALAELTNSKHDKEMAAAAEAKYVAHEAKQKEADKL